MNPLFQAGHTYLCTDALRQAHRQAAEQAARGAADVDADDTHDTRSAVRRGAGLLALVLSCSLVGTAVFVGDALAQRVA
jgi:hypothetical protein